MQCSTVHLSDGEEEKRGEHWVRNLGSDIKVALSSLSRGILVREGVLSLGCFLLLEKSELVVQAIYLNKEG